MPSSYIPPGGGPTPSPDPMPAGSIVQYGGATAPSGWLLCDGATLSRTTYAALFAAIEEAFGAGDGSTTFQVPDFTNRVPVGNGTLASLATPVGAETVNLPDHQHALSNGSAGSDGSPAADVASVGGGSTGSPTGGASLSIIQPSLGVNFIIKT